MSHRILLSTVHFDVPSRDREATRAFWSTALGATTRLGRGAPAYDVFEDAAAGLPVVVQDVGDDGPRIHLDIETDDVPAEVARLLAAGATHVADRSHPDEEWVVLRDPAGMEFCVVPVHTAEFETRAATVE